ncbi:hypothetical protein ACFW4X_22255 [Streptomyces smyrnaeus]|uniref:hypothetical protein n=1 Tax=Streptomyces smyrnaeus TaxID=1387713 RepID=UPI00367E8314
MSDAHAATEQHLTTEPAPGRVGGEANEKDAVSDAHAATEQHLTTEPAPGRVGGEANEKDAA